MAQLARPRAISFDAPLQRIGSSIVLRLPAKASQQLPSRGQVAVNGAIDGHTFEIVLEPDGCGFARWMRVDEDIRRAAGIGVGDSATLEIEIKKEWPEPNVPPDLAAALARAPQKIREVWKDITPMARWEWVRWVNETRSPDTRRRRVAVSLSKMNSGKRRPCCFDLASCTDPELARSGKLLSVTDRARGAERTGR